MTHEPENEGHNLQAAPVEKLLRPLQRFDKLEASGGIILVAAAAFAMAWANSPWADSYTALWELPFSVGSGSLSLEKPLLLWINDGLMAVFFFLVGLEIKREVLIGELASVRRAALPIIAAVGGMAVPAVLYTVLNANGRGASGWAVPMATDIAFALGILSLAGRAVPSGLKVFLIALAIIDDLGAVLVIALFYSGGIQGTALLVAGVCLAALCGLNLLGVRRPLPYALLGCVAWVAVLKSGVHATIAGVLVAMTIPARTRLNVPQFVGRVRGRLRRMEAAETDEAARSAGVGAIEQDCERVQTPLQRIEHDLHPWVAYFIMPVFALANAGVSLDSGAIGAWTDPISLGIALGLLIGKPVGILGGAWVAVKLGLGALPSAVSWRHIAGAGVLGGIGFTMSLFIAGMAFDGTDHLASKIGILGASSVAGLLGWTLVRMSTAGSGAPAPQKG